MTAPEICDAAGRGEKPEGLDAAGELLWYRVSDIYAAHKRGTITPAEGKSQKAKAVLAYNMDHAHIEGGKAAMQRTAEFLPVLRLPAIFTAMTAPSRPLTPCSRLYTGFKEDTHGRQPMHPRLSGTVSHMPHNVREVPQAF